MTTFVLDLESNPHKKLLALAIDAKQRARDAGPNFAAKAFYLGVLFACAEATGCELSDIAAWVQHHAGTPVEDPLEVETMVAAIRLAFA